MKKKFKKALKKIKSLNERLLELERYKKLQVDASLSNPKLR